MNFYNSWKYLNNLDMVKDGRISMLQECLNIKVVNVNKDTLKIDENEDLNTETRVWLEFGKVIRDESTGVLEYFHDTDFDCGAETFEEAIIILSILVKSKIDSEDETK